MDLKHDIRAVAHRIGFRRCGFAQVEPLVHADFVRQWLAEGNAASMGYIQRGLPKRLDPRLILPGARSVITVGYRYLPPPVPPTDWRQQLRGRIAAYAFDVDYHLTVKVKLKELAAGVRAMRSGTMVRACVDTSAVLEREWASRGGIGWFGKNTNLLHAEDGSYFFLGELLTNLELEPDALVPDHCGTCTRCLDLCPTAALKPGYRLDARRCISYWTIEHRGTIPAEFRPHLGNWIFGCDICQEVCPWNERLIRRAGAPDADLLLPYLPDLLALDDEGFRARFGRSAVKRTGREGLLRNVAVVLGNTGNPAAVPALAVALSGDPSAVVRVHAAWALGAIGGPVARRAVQRAHRCEREPSVQAALQAALDNHGSPGDAYGGIN